MPNALFAIFFYVRGAPICRPLHSEKESRENRLGKAKYSRLHVLRAVQKVQRKVKTIENKKTARFENKEQEKRQEFGRTPTRTFFCQLFFVDGTGLLSTFSRRNRTFFRV